MSTEPTYTRKQVMAAFESALSDISDRAVLDEPIVDALNLLLNTGASYLEHPDEMDLDQAIVENYSEEPDVVLGWLE